MASVLVLIKTLARAPLSLTPYRSGTPHFGQNDGPIPLPRYLLQAGQRQFHRLKPRVPSTTANAMTPTAAGGSPKKGTFAFSLATARIRMTAITGRLTR